MTRKRRSGRVFVVSSPSGGGKTTVVQRLLKKHRGLRRGITVTTRLPRRGERPGRDYHFVSPQAFDQLRRGGRFLEWARVHGASYGTPKRPVLRALADGYDVVLNIDVQGARQIRRALGERAVLVFLVPPSMAELKRRLQHRRTETVKTIQRRMRAARRELRCARWYDYQVVNDRLAQTVRRLETLMAASEGATQRQRRGTSP